MREEAFPGDPLPPSPGGPWTTTSGSLPPQDTLQVNHRETSIINVLSSNINSTVLPSK